MSNFRAIPYHVRMLLGALFLVSLLCKPGMVFASPVPKSCDSARMYYVARCQEGTCTDGFSVIYEYTGIGCDMRPIMYDFPSEMHKVYSAVFTRNITGETARNGLFLIATDTCMKNVLAYFERSRLIDIFSEDDPGIKECLARVYAKRLSEDASQEHLLKEKEKWAEQIDLSSALYYLELWGIPLIIVPLITFFMVYFIHKISTGTHSTGTLVMALLCASGLAIATLPPLFVISHPTSQGLRNSVAIATIAEILLCFAVCLFYFIRSCLVGARTIALPDETEDSANE